MKTIILYFLIFALFLTIPLVGNHSISTLADTQSNRNYVIIDAGHGGVDGGAVSYTGVYESKINLEISSRVNDLMHLLGLRTIMIRDTDKSVYTDGQTIAAKKISDIKERVRIINTTPQALLISIHQNHFHDARYSGAQVFYNNTADSKLLAEKMQQAFRENLNPANKRKQKLSSGVYLMDHINCTGLLIECGFLSNPGEEAMLRDTVYQQKISAVITTTVSQYLNT